MAANNEIGNVIIPQHTNFAIKFDHITLDGNSFNFNIATGWIFAMHSAISGTPLILKASTGVATSGDFSIDSTNKTVTVLVRASELSYGYGEYYSQLTMASSGNRLSHMAHYVHIRPALSTSGV